MGSADQCTIVEVRDVAAHLLDTVLRKLSMVRDSCYVEATNIRSHEDVIALVNRLNAEGVTVYHRLSPPVLIDIMKAACQQSASFHESLDPFAPAAFNVSWAGEETSLNWFDTARELTVLDCFVRGLPHVYRDVDAPIGTVLLLEISGECGGQWFLSRGSTGWNFVSQSAGELASRVTIPQELAWRVFTKGIDRDSARPQMEIEGNRDLGEKLLRLTAIVG